MPRVRRPPSLSNIESGSIGIGSGPVPGPPIAPMTIRLIIHDVKPQVRFLRYDLSVVLILSLDLKRHGQPRDTQGCRCRPWARTFGGSVSPASPG